jgi:fatty acid desaturase
MNPEYRRQMPAPMVAKMRRWELLVVGSWAGVLAMMLAGVLPWRTLLLWYGVLALVSLVNTLRVLGAHAYELDGTPHDRRGQLADSLDTPGGPWTELWAPVGLRYHALHHYFPGIPYHNLGVAYRRIVETVPGRTLYRQSTSPSLRRSLASLYEKAKRSGTAALSG